MDSSKIYNILIESLLAFLLVFTPLAYGAVRPGAIAAFEIAAAAMAFLWVLKSLSRGKLKLSFSPIFLLFLVLIIFASLQLLFSLTTPNSQLPTTIYSWATKTELLKLISYALIFLVTLNTIRTRAQIKRVMAAIITIGFFMSIFFLMRYFGASAPIGFINADHFSAYLGMIIPLSLGFIICVIARSPKADETQDSVIARSPANGGTTKPFDKSSGLRPEQSRRTKQSHPGFGPRPLLFFTIIIMGGALFFTMSRGGMFSFIAALIFIALLVSTRRSMKNKKWLILAIAVFIVLIIAWLGATPVVERILSFKAEIASRYYGGRLPIWEGTIGIIKDNFIFGTGLGTFNCIFPKYQPIGIVAKHYTYAHSDFLELLSEIGIVGFALTLVCGLWTAIYLFRRYSQRHDPWVTGMSICVFGSLASIFIHSFTDFSLHIPANAVLLSVILALFVSILNTTNETSDSVIVRRPDETSSLRGRDDRRESRALSREAPEVISITTAFLTVILLIIYSIASVRPAMADHYASISSLRGGCEGVDSPVIVRRPTCPERSRGKADEAISKAITLDPTNAEYYYELGKQQGALKAYSLQLIAYKKAVALNPTNSQYHQSLAWAYGQINKVSQAHQEFEAAIELSPTYYYPPQVYATWLFSYPTVENIEKGVEVYRKAVVLNPKLADKALVDYFKVEKSYAQLKRILPDTPENHSKVMVMLLDVDLWEANASEFKKDMEVASYKYPYYKAISLYYEKMGDHVKSVEVLRDYLKLDPNCADAHFYIADRIAYMKPRNWPEVFAHHERALALAPENTFYREWYARHLYYAKRYNDAIAELEKVVAKNEQNIELQRLLSDWKKAPSLR